MVCQVGQGCRGGVGNTILACKINIYLNYRTATPPRYSKYLNIDGGGGYDTNTPHLLYNLIKTKWLNKINMQSNGRNLE